MNGPVATPPLLKALQSSIGVLRWLMLLLLLIYLVSNFRIVGPNESALVMRFGRLTEKVHSPGFLPALPAPVDEVFVVPTRSVSEIELDGWAAAALAADAQGEAAPEDGAQEPYTMFDALDRADSMAIDEDTLHPVRDGYGLTGDVNLIHARFSVRYSITDPRQYVLNVRDPEQILRPLLMQAAGSVARSMAVDDILTSGRDRFLVGCEKFAQQRIDQLGLGITLQAWDTREIAPANQVLDAFEAVTSAKVEARTMLEQANTYRQSTMPQAKADAYRTTQEASAEASSQVAKAEGSAVAFLAMSEAARESPHAFRTRQFNETLENVLERCRVPAIDATRGKGVRILMGGIQ